MRSIGKWENTVARVHTKHKSLMVCEGTRPRFLINQYLFYIWWSTQMVREWIANPLFGSSILPSTSKYGLIAQLVRAPHS